MRQINSLKIDNVQIGPDYPPYIIAEISANHQGKISQALKLVELAKRSGAQAVKLQTYTPDTMTIDSDREDFQIKGGLWDGCSLYELYKKAHTPWEWHETIFNKAHEVGITCFSTPFDETAVDFLEDLNVPAYKIASFEMIDLPLVEYIAGKNKPIIISTGLATFEEIKETLETIRQFHNKIILMHCVSGYPAPESQYNLRTIPDLIEKFNVMVGLSDHTLSTTTSISGISMGAVAIEKHFIENREQKGPDSQFSIEPGEMSRLCKESNTAWESLGKIDYDLQPSEKESLKFRRSIYFVKDIKQGEAITREHIRRIRPGFGVAPKYYNALIGRKVKADVDRGTPVSFDVLMTEDNATLI